MSMATTSRRRRKGILSEDDHLSAVGRFRAEANARANLNRGTVGKDRPEHQQAAAEQIRSRSNRQRRVSTHGGAVNAPERGGTRLTRVSGPRRFQTTRGLRRLSFRQAYGRRTTDTSRARVLSLYGRTRPPGPTAGAPRATPGGSRRLGGERPSTGGARYMPRSDYSAGLNKVAQMRSKTLGRRMRRTRRLLPRSNSGRRYF